MTSEHSEACQSCRFPLRARFAILLSVSTAVGPFMKRSSPLHTKFLSPHAAAQIISQKGLKACLAGVATYIKEDFLRWPSFDKCARIASHSGDGVIELMPIADEHTYTFKY